MKTLINWERKVVEQAWMSQYLFSLSFDIPQVWLNCFAKLKFEDEAFINNLYEELLNVSEEKLTNNKMFYEKDWNQIAFNKYAVSTLIMDYLTQAIQNLNDSGKALMTVYIDEEKETLKKYREKQKLELDTLKEHINNNNKEIEKLNLSQQNIVSKTAWIDNEKSATPRWDDEVALTTTQEIKTRTERKNEKKVSTKPQPTSLVWMLKWKN